MAFDKNIYIYIYIYSINDSIIWKLIILRDISLEREREREKAT
jgi:hypothetical protein